MPFDTFNNTHPPVDTELVDRIVSKLKSQGIFDQFRKDCLADVDTKPAYQNLHQRVNVTVASFLATQKWQPDLNKTQLRESLRRHVQQGFLEVGVDRIVDQVVNPKIVPLFMPKVEDVVYDCLGIEKPKLPLSARLSTQFLTSFPPPLPRPCTPPKAAITDLLPKDLDPVSPESDSVCLNGSETPLKDEINNTNTSNKFEDDQDSQLSGISELSSHMGDSFRENPDPVDSNTVRSISSPKSDSKDLQFDNFTNLSEKIKQAEKSHGQVSGIQPDKVENDVSDKSLNDISLPEELIGSSPKENRDEIVSEDTKIESMSNNSLSNFDDSKTFTSSKLFKDDTILTFSDESFSSNVTSRLKEENSTSKAFQNSENTNGPLIIAQPDNLVSKNFEQPEKTLPKVDQTNDFLKMMDHSDDLLLKENDQSEYLKENDSNGPESLDGQKDDKLNEINMPKKCKEKSKDKKSRDSSTSSKYSRSSDRHKHSDSKQRTHDKNSKATERDHSLYREDKEDKSRKDDKIRPSHRDDGQKSLQKPDKEISSHKNEKESTTYKEPKEISKKECKDKTHSKDKEKLSKEDSHKSQRDEKKKSNDEKRKNSDKDKKIDKIKDIEKESRKECKNDLRDNYDKEKKGSNVSNKEKELIYKNKEANEKEKEESLRSKRDSDRNRHDKSDKDREHKNNEKDIDKYKSDKDRENKNTEKDSDKNRDKNRTSKDKHDKDRNGKQSKEKSSPNDDKSRESKKSSYDKCSNSTSSGKKTDNGKVDDLEKKSKVDENSRNRNNTEKSKIDDKKERKRKGERCNDEVKSKDARRSSDRDSNGSKGGSSHRSNLEYKSSSSRNSKHSSSEKKSRGSSSNGAHGSQDQTDNISLSLEEDANESLGERLNCYSNNPMQQSLKDSSRVPSEVDLILSRLNSSIKEIENAHCNSESEIPVKKPKIAKNFAEMRKIMLVRKNMERKFKNEVNGHKDLNEYANNKTDESPSSAENRAEISEENKENFKSPGFDKSNPNLLKNNNNKTKEFHGFSDKDIEKVLNQFLTFENIFGSVKYKRLFDFTENIVSSYKNITVDNCEELLDNNLNKLVPKPKSFLDVSIADSKLIERAVSGGNRCYVLLQQDCPEVTKHLKREKWKEEESPQSSPAQGRVKGKGLKRGSRARTGAVKAIRAHDEVRMEGSVMPANDEPSEAGPVGEAFTPDELRCQQANIGQQPELKESVSHEYDVNSKKLKLCPPESPNSEFLFPASPDSISDEDGGLSVSLTEDMLNNLMKESMGGLSGSNDNGDPYDSECEGLIESSEIVCNSEVVKENFNADVRENLSPHLGKNCDPCHAKRAKSEDSAKKGLNKRQSRSSQRYGSNDLYKPRPVFNSNSRRNRATTEIGIPKSESVIQKRDQSEPPIKRTAR